MCFYMSRIVKSYPFSNGNYVRSSTADFDGNRTINNSMFKE
jgi:hypothetical protein